MAHRKGEKKNVEKETEDGKSQSQTKRNHEEKSRWEFHMKPSCWELFINGPISSFCFCTEE
jgi:hypothetical protein